MQNDILHSEVEAIKKHAQQLVQQNTGFVEKIAKIEVQQETIKEKQKEASKRIDSLQDDLVKEIRTSVGEIRTSISDRITDINKVLINQQDTQARLIEIQGRQGVQIDEIRKTLEEFTKVQATTHAHETKITELETRIKTLEKKVTEYEDTEAATKNSRVQGKWATVAAITSAVVSGILAIIGTILMTVVK